MTDASAESIQQSLGGDLRGYVRTASSYLVGSVAVEVICALVFATVVVSDISVNGQPFMAFGMAWGFALDRAPLATTIASDLSGDAGLTEDVKVLSAGYALGFAVVLIAFRRLGGETDV